MGAIYGEMLLFFPERFQVIPYFDRLPLENDNYGPKIYEATTRGILETKGGNVRDNNDNIVRESMFSWWTASGLIPGRFTELEGVLYRFMTDSPWPSQGGFFQYDLEKVVGSDGTNTAGPTWNTGENSFG